MADALWTPEELLAATGGRFTTTVKQPLAAVSIDSRTIAAGDIFVAIKGDKNDGHDYAAAALRAGAGLAIVSRTTPAMEAAGPLLVVADDPLRGLEGMARAARARSAAQIIGVTGSVGKTSAKEMLLVALSASGQTHASMASFNNHWGVPLTLARLPRSAAFGVFEIGMSHSGEITPLVALVRPHVAIVTTIAPSHLGNFASLEEIADAKAEIFSGVAEGGAAIINGDSPYFGRLAAAAKAMGVKNVFGFGKGAACQIRLERVALHPTCCCITADVLGEKVSYRLGMPGEHMALNSLAVLAAAKLAGADLARAAISMSQAKPAKGRGVQQALRMADGELLLIDESYNANPASVRAALGLLAQAKTGKNGRRIAVLGDMLELGEHGPRQHGDLAEALDSAKVDVLYAAGPLMAHLWEATPNARRGAHAENSGQLQNALLADLRAGDVVMVKGSNSSRMGLLVDAMKAKWPAAIKEQ